MDDKFGRAPRRGAGAAAAVSADGAFRLAGTNDDRRVETGEVNIGLSDRAILVSIDVECCDILRFPENNSSVLTGLQETVRHSSEHRESTAVQSSLREKVSVECQIHY